MKKQTKKTDFKQIKNCWYEYIPTGVIYSFILKNKQGCWFISENCGVYINKIDDYKKYFSDEEYQFIINNYFFLLFALKSITIGAATKIEE